jgi:hypothetical protein
MIDPPDRIGRPTIQNTFPAVLGLGAYVFAKAQRQRLAV